MQRSKIASFSLVLISFSFFLNISSPAAEPELGGGRISLIQGKVLIQAKDEEGWAEGVANFPIIDGDRILTEKDGRVEVQFKNGTCLRVGEESQIDIVALSFDRGKEFIHLNQLEGRVYVNHRSVTEETSYIFIDFPYGVLSAYVPSRFRVDLTPSEARISVLEGSIEFKRDGRPIPLAQGRTLITSEGGSVEMAQLYGRDEWDRWNETRDRELFQRQYAQEYLPPGLERWGYEMEGYGRWVYSSEYQYVWVPTVAVGWAPYCHGHWAWRRGIYCWIPHEPWGWVPFHYGRWVHIYTHGWVWVPPFRHAVIWHPGAVAWHIGPTYVSWVPLAPGEVYYGYRYYGPHNVNITRVNIDIQKNVYMNAKIKDAVMTVHRNSFFRRHPVRTDHVVNPFLHPLKASAPPIEKPVFLDGKRTPSRPIKESVGRVQPERKPSPKEGGRDIPSVKRDPKVIEQGRFTESPQKRVISETARNRVERIERSNRQTDPPQRNLVKRDSSPVPPREGVKIENQVPIQRDNKNKNVPIAPSTIVKIPNEKEPKNFQESEKRNVSRDVHRDRFERAAQTNSPRSLSKGQEGKVFSGSSSSSERRFSPAPDSKGQVVQPYLGSRGGWFGSSSTRTLR